MSFSYNPMTEEEAEKERQFPMLEPGTYNFEVMKSEFKMSNTGQYRNPNKPSNPMIKLQLLVWGSDGKEYTVFDFLVGSKNMEWKTRHFCRAVGLLKEYEAKTFNESICEGKSGKVSIIQQKGQPKEGGGFYQDKNAVEDYISDESTKTTKPDFDDDVPF